MPGSHRAAWRCAPIHENEPILTAFRGGDDFLFKLRHAKPGTGSILDRVRRSFQPWLRLSAAGTRAECETVPAAHTFMFCKSQN
jgi:hypothetical protein